MSKIRHHIRRFHGTHRGISVAELLIASVLSVIVIAAAFEFYITQHRAWLMQDEVSDVQHNARSCLNDIADRLKMAGYGLPAGHPAFAIGQDSLTIYARPDATIDTVTYYVHYVDSLSPVLVRDLPSTGSQIYSDGIENLSVTQVSASLLQVVLTARTERTDEEFLGGDGYRRRQLTTQVRARNIAL